MKTLKFFVLFSLFLAFIAGNVNSQPVRMEYSNRVYFNVPCIGEPLSGLIVVERTVWFNLKDGSLHLYSKIQLKYDHVILYGYKTGLPYTLNFVSQSGWGGEGNEGESADVNHFVRMAMIRFDGKLVALLPIHVQKVQTPDDNIVVNINDFEVRCF